MSTEATFKDFNLKLAVVQSLMFDSDVLLPRFELRDFAELHGLDLGKHGDEIIPEVRAYFEGLMVPAQSLGSVRSIYQDGGNEIYMSLCPRWDGEDDRFNIRFFEDDVRQLTSLKQVTLFFDEDPAILESFKKLGIQASWL